MNKYKISKRIIYSYILIGLPISLLAVFFSIGIFTDEKNFDFEKLHIFIFIIIFVIIYSLIIFLSYLFYKSAFFYFTENSIIYERGILIKFKTELSFDKINNINKNRNLINILFKTTNIKIDSGSVKTAALAEINLTIDKENYDKIYNLIYNKVNNIVEEEKEKKEIDYNNYFKIKNDFYFKMPFYNSFYAILFFNLLISTFIFVIFVFSDIFILEKYRNKTILICLIIFVVLNVFIYFVRVLNYFLKYYNFTLKRDKNNNIVISYGLLDQKIFNFKINRVNALILKQHLNQRLFKTYSMKVSVIGIGSGNSSDQNNNSESRYVFPLCNKHLKDIIIKTIFYEFSEEFNDFLKPKKCFTHFYLVPLLLELVIIFIPLIITIVLKQFFIFVYFSPYIVLSLILKSLVMKNTGFIVKNNIIYASNGYFIKNIYLINKNSLQQYDYYFGFIRKKHQVATIKLSYKEIGFPLKIRNIDTNYLKEIDKKLDL